MTGIVLVAVAYVLVAGAAETVPSGPQISARGMELARTEVESANSPESDRANMPLLAQSMEAGNHAGGPGKKSGDQVGHGNHIVVEVGKQFEVSQDSNPSTGYQWQLFRPRNEGVVKLVGKKYVSPATKLLGAGGKDVWTFQGVGRGTTKIVLKYLRPWEKGLAPAKEVVYTVEVR